MAIRPHPIFLPIFDSKIEEARHEQVRPVVESRMHKIAEAVEEHMHVIGLVFNQGLPCVHGFVIEEIIRVIEKEFHVKLKLVEE